MVETAKKKKANKKKNRIGILCLICLIILFGRAHYKRGIGPVSLENPVEVSFEIPMGSSTSKVSDILESNGLINSKLIFKYIVRKDALDGKLKAGQYTLNSGMNVEEIVESLSKGGKNTNIVKFTIPEGYELKQIARRLSENGLVDEERFINLTEDASKFADKYDFLKEAPEGSSLEGYLFPSTYDVESGASEEVIIEKMLNTFGEIYKTTIKNGIKDTGLSLNELVALASIVEREGKVDEERPLIAAVFYNRIKQGKPLESCATVQYALGERKEKLTFDDLKIESDYNTYKHKGLPPGPIASPGLKSIEAAINPANVDYLFFVSNGDGTHTFTTNFKDHLDAKNKNNH
ncbi:endolytic transglycosylase MltG [Anaerosalibacter sp. Marseille-P3206]|uniref:endolytic transglycosylase MltG n=1 Tax=Anaerosalibacter sp. Marseille-P3206 TaxID=1871005 RepID=UPI0013563B0A|nr:endolytic transglycosylase MltG [Anaerosalibacter sp. Marseille-P3206]